jgi:hypothetical protein
MGDASACTEYRARAPSAFPKLGKHSFDHSSDPSGKIQKTNPIRHDDPYVDDDDGQQKNSAVLQGDICSNKWFFRLPVGNSKKKKIRFFIIWNIIKTIHHIKNFPHDPGALGIGGGDGGAKGARPCKGGVVKGFGGALPATMVGMAMPTWNSFWRSNSWFWKSRFWSWTNLEKSSNIAEVFELHRSFLNIQNLMMKIKN